jgi:hypothetical protein
LEIEQQLTSRLRDWIATIPSWPETFVYKPMKETALELSKELRNPAGEHKVDIIIALTHSRVPNVSWLSLFLWSSCGQADGFRTSNLQMSWGQSQERQVWKTSMAWICLLAVMIM